MLEANFSEDFDMNILETMLDEEYPTNFSMDHFKKLNSFNARIKYCEENLQRISSGSSRIVYKIDNEKVLKLAKNKKGLGQNEVEISYSHYRDIEDIIAKVFDYDENNLWTEMELARRVTKPIFKQITGFDFDAFGGCLINYSMEIKGRSSRFSVNKEIEAALWEDEYGYEMLSFIGNYDIPTGDLARLSSYGLVKRNGEDAIVLIDYGLTNEVYKSYYS